MAKIPPKIPKNQSDLQAGTIFIDTDRNSPLIYSDGMFLSGNTPEGWVNVKDFGAKGDGINDDTQAIQDAINKAKGKTLFIPNGTYLITQPLNLTNIPDPGMKIKAFGTFKFKDIDSILMDFTGSRNIKIYGLSIEYTTSSNIYPQIVMLFARSQLIQYAEFNELHWVKISVPKATYGMYNYGAELFRLSHCDINSKNPIVFTNNPNYPYSPTSLFTDIFSAVTSMSHVRLTSSWFRGNDSSGNIITVRAGWNITFDDIYVNGSCDSVFLFGTDNNRIQLININDETNGQYFISFFQTLSNLFLSGIKTDKTGLYALNSIAPCQLEKSQINIQGSNTIITDDGSYGTTFKQNIVFASGTVNLSKMGYVNNNIFIGNGTINLPGTTGFYEGNIFISNKVFRAPQFSTSYEANTNLGSISGRIPLYDNNGNIIGYIPLYSG